MRRPSGYHIRSGIPMAGILRTPGPGSQLAREVSFSAPSITDGGQAPASRDVAHPRPLPWTRAEVHSLPWPHVLVVDENTDILDIMRQFFEDEGFSVTLSPTFVAPVDIVRLAPDIVLMDGMVNGADRGSAFVRRCRNDPILYDMPILCCTTSRAMAASMAALGILTVFKPFDLDYLLVAIRGTMKPAIRLHSPAVLYGGEFDTIGH